MKPPPFKYARPESLEDVLALVEEYGDEAKPLAGGQSLIPLLNMRLARPSVIIDLARIHELAHLNVVNDELHVGAMVRQRVLEGFELTRGGWSIFGQALAFVAHPQIRNRGTIGGSLVHADPAAELPAVALATNARLTLASTRQQRVVAADDFFVGPFTTECGAQELLIGVEFPPLDGAVSYAVEIARQRGDFALAGIAAVLWPNNAGGLVNARIAGFGVSGTPMRLRQTEEALLVGPLTRTAVREAASIASDEVNPVSDVHADADFRRELVSVLITRIMSEVAQ